MMMVQQCYSFFRLHWQWIMLGVLIALSGCSTEPAQEREAPAAQPSAAAQDTAAPQVRLQMPYFQLRERPHEDSKSLAVLEKGAPLYLLGQISERSTRLELQGTVYFQPWVLVRTQDGAEGWVHAAALGSTLPDRVRLKALLGEALAKSCQAYRKQYSAQHPPDDCTDWLREAQQLADGLTLAFQVQPPAQANWVASLLPGLTPFWQESDRSVHFFVDYTDFEEAVRQSASRADDALLELYYQAYPVDSVGYWYPGWMLEVETGRAFSLLGKGACRAYLQSLDEALVYEDVIGPEIDRLRGRLINDITDPAVLFWEPASRAKAELRQILDQGFEVLRPEDTLRLHQLYRQWQDTSAQTLHRFDHRSGRYQ